MLSCVTTKITDKDGSILTFQFYQCTEVSESIWKLCSGNCNEVAHPTQNGSSKEAIINLANTFKNIEDKLKVYALATTYSCFAEVNYRYAKFTLCKIAVYVIN